MDIFVIPVVERDGPALYNGGGDVTSVQVPGSLSYPLGAHSGSFEQTLANADIRAIMKRDEAAILSRCTSEENLAALQGQGQLHTRLLYHRNRR